MISYPPPKFEEQRSEILQRYQLISDDKSNTSQCLASAISLSLRSPFVVAALNNRYRTWYYSMHGLTDFSESDLQTYFARTHLSQVAFSVDDLQSEAYFTNHTRGLQIPKFGAMAGVPLTDPNGKRFGTLCVADLETRIWSDVEMAMLASFGSVMSNDICMRSAARYAVRDLIELEQEKCELFELATVDPLTKSLNRRAFTRFSERELARCNRENGRLSALMLDIDHFKQVNDVHGHAAGDKVLAKLVSVASTALRQEDLIGRLGGEEFAIVLVDAHEDAAAQVADRIRRAIKQAVFLSEAGSFNVTVSIGISAPYPNELSISAALERADAALYQAKRSGRDCVKVAASPFGASRPQSSRAPLRLVK